MSDWGWVIPTAAVLVVGLSLRKSISDLSRRLPSTDYVFYPDSRESSDDSPSEPVTPNVDARLNARPFDWRCADDRGSL